MSEYLLVEGCPGDVCAGIAIFSLSQAQDPPGKPGRFINEEWAYARDWDSDTQRSEAHQHFMHHYNEHRPHGALNWDTPMATLTRLSGDNVLGMHS